MERIEKTVFISYRRTHAQWALAIYQSLNANGFDVFFDYTGIASGDFEQIIIGNIRARAHFLLLLAPSALERCDEPGDWLRREIEAAIDSRRNIIPLMLDGFSFESPSTAPYLTGKLELLKCYNGIDVPIRYFKYAMQDLQEKYLNVQLSAVLHPIPPEVTSASAQQKEAASAAPTVGPDELAAQAWFERGFSAADPDESIRCYSEGIRLRPNYAWGLLCIGSARQKKGDFEGAIRDYSEAIRLDPDCAKAFSYRGTAQQRKGDLEDAIRDYSEAIRLDPDDASAFSYRGNARQRKGYLEGAIRDYSEAIRLNPDDAEVFNNRGTARQSIGDLEDAIRDYSEAIRLNPDYANAYRNRGTARQRIGNREGAIRDYSEAIWLDSDNAEAFSYRGRLREWMGDSAGAAEDFEAAKRLGPKSEN